jgi:outer membrane protein assembly factor BamB
MDVPPTNSPAAPPTPSPAPGVVQRSGTVGDLVPMLQAEEAAPLPPEADSTKHVSEMVPVAPSSPAVENRPSDGEWWQSAPPVRVAPRQPAASQPAAPPPARKPTSPITKEKKQRPAPSPRPAEETQPMPVMPEQPSGPRELPPGAWEPPPVRRGEQAKETPKTETPAEKADDETHRPLVGKRKAFRFMAALFVVTFAVLGSVGAWVWVKFQASEEAWLADARTAYQNGSYTNAAEQYRRLAQKFPDSPHVEEYRFLAVWSSVWSVAADPDADPADGVDKLEQFLKDHKKDSLMEEHAREAGQMALKLSRAFAGRNANPANDEPLKAADRLDALRSEVAAVAPDALSKEESGQIDADLGTVRRAVERARKRRSVLTELQQHDKEAPMDALRRARALLARMERELPGIGKDPEAEAALLKLEDAHQASVVFVPRNEDMPPPPPRPVDNAESLLFAPLLPNAAPGNASAGDAVVPFLARGVLYALSQSNGELKWATRVGIDTTVLPPRVPASPTNPELMLVLSADSQTLSALDDKGFSLWEYSIGQAVLGRPIVIGPRAYLAAYDGTIHEIELARGQLLGRWTLGQRLTCGGTREGNTSRIYFPADDSCIYVLDVDPSARRCVAILYDGHPSGSLRGEPVVVAPEGDAPGYLILNRVSGLDAMSLRVFELPLQGRHAPEVTLEPPARFSGWTWFDPKQDGEKLAIVSDAGILGLFGIRQPGNQDQALFPYLQPGGLDLSPLLRSERELPRERSRAQVVSMQGDELWVLAHGRFQHLELRWNAANGPQALPRWSKPLTLGSPLHEARHVEDRDGGRSTFFLATQAMEQQTCLASAVDEDGKVRWQRQLGLVCRDEPLTLTPPDGGAPVLLVQDRGGGLFVIDPQDRHHPQFLAPPLDDNSQTPPMLLPLMDGHAALEIASPGEGRSLLVRRIEWSAGERRLRVRTSETSMVSQVDNSVRSLAGPPAILGSHLLLPMTDGNLLRMPLAFEESRPQTGPTWRDSLAPASASCGVVALGGDRFLTTDGGRNLSVFEWPTDRDKIWRRIFPREGEPKPLQELIATPPVLLPPRADAPPRVVIGDSANVLHLFVVAPDGALNPQLTWNLKGRITAGPFVHTTAKGETRLACILDRRHFVWLDPAKPDPLWTYSTEGETIVGQPRLIEGLLMVALQSGRYLAVDPENGQAIGKGYNLRASAAPAASPTPFSPGVLFAPLSDGTALLLSHKQIIRQDKK